VSLTHPLIAIVIQPIGQVYRFDPKTQTCKLESWRTNKLLMKRYHAVLRAKDADVFGILIGTLGVGMSPSPYIFYTVY